VHLGIYGSPQPWPTFQVYELLAGVVTRADEILFKTVNESTWLDLARRHAADAHLDSLVVTESPLENEEPAVGQLGGIGNVKAYQPLHGN
jgi:hypothetical protein